MAKSTFARISILNSTAKGGDGMIGTAIKETREEKGITQEELGQTSFLSSKTISAIETGRRNLTKESLKAICMELDDPRVYFEAANEVTGDVFALHWLDGEAADLHRASVKDKVIEELDEAIKAINLTRVYKNPIYCNTEDKKAIEESIKETIDVYVASAIYIAVMCKEYSVNIKEMFKDQKEKMINRGYVKR
ncbi:helix-turn-helix domain-containing protein [Clostridium sp. WILCCON 0269]|uniref:Helix-turn-helix domain-containing protein n=1 Tax=Candidatus Clostridium eludens TaxID=3381663 RepID=A0ABW8SMK1_9CLOT